MDSARSSLMEVSAVLEIARDVGYVDPSVYARLEARCEEASKTLYGLLRSVEKRLESGAARRP